MKALTDAGVLGMIGELHGRTRCRYTQRLQTLIKDHQERKPPTHAQLIRAKLIDEVKPVRALLKALTDLLWAATDNHPVTAAMTLLQGLYAQNQRQLPADISLEFGSVWDAAVKDDNRERAFKALEVATLSGVHRALRNGSVWIEHSLAFRGRAHPPTHIEGLNLRGIFRFPIEEYAEQLLSTAIRKTVKQGYYDVRNPKNVAFTLANGKYRSYQNLPPDALGNSG